MDRWNLGDMDDFDALAEMTLDEFRAQFMREPAEGEERSLPPARVLLAIATIEIRRANPDLPLAADSVEGRAAAWAEARKIPFEEMIEFAPSAGDDEDAGEDEDPNELSGLGDEEPSPADAEIA